ncbi:MAG: TonB-dependent receptor [Alphaproteobacteria bacterium]|nr:TonB-dependent receptor [Alphaproteobacteria bacterium]MDE2341305.1 TonB-dependent receptor [Alphaproteobacteria bacterium]
MSLSVAASALVLVALSPVCAANPESANGNSASSNEKGDIVVTARSERHDKEFESDQTDKVLDRDQIRAVSVVGGAAKALALVPGVSTSSYGATGSQKTTISIDGVKVGWAGFSGGNPDNGAVGVTFDDVPMSNPGNGLWQATLVPQTSLIQTIGATYGPGAVTDRWFTNIGGGLAFTPLQPTAEAGGEVAATYGSFQTKNISASLQTGDVGGWQTVAAGGLNGADSYLNAPDGFKNPSHNDALYIKTTKQFAHSDISIGFYTAHSGADRPLATPVTPIPGVTQAGYQQNAPLFSQATTGFFSTLPLAVNYKFDSNSIIMGYVKVNADVSSSVKFHSLTYITHESRLHYTTLHDYVQGSESGVETNQPSSLVGGEKLSFDITLPHNVLTIGGYAQASRYHSREQLYNPALGFVNSPVPAPAGLTGSALAPNGNYFSDVFEQLDTAIFLQDVFKPFSNLALTPGVRFVGYYTNFYHDEASEFPNGVLYNPGGNLSFFPSATKTEMRLEPAFGANWKALSWLSLFGNYERTFKQPENGGGTGPYVALPAATVKLEEGNYYQLGFKMRKNRLGPATDLSLDVTLSQLDYTNETIPTALASGGALLAFGSSRYRALSIFADASPIPRLYTFVNLGIVDAKFTNYVNGNGTFNNVPIAYTPDTTLNVGAYYKGNVGDVTFTPRVSYAYTGSQYIYDNSMNITSNTKLATFGIVNAALEVGIPASSALGFIKSATVTLEADNLFDKNYNAFEYISAGGLYGSGGSTNPTTVGLGALLALPAPPRAFYVSLGFKF